MTLTKTTNLTLKKEPVIASSVLGMLIFILTEMMVFASFISSFNIIKSGYKNWPPLGQPRLPLEITGINSLFLFASAWFLHRAYKSFGNANTLKRHSDQLLIEGALRQTRKFFLVSLFLTLVFVLIQGIEWVRLLSYGLTMTSSLYGSFFYLIIGTHALHVMGALLALVIIYQKLAHGNLKIDTFAAMLAFWFFVVGLWPVLYALVYL